jgi:uncharacterized membrane protein YidH (DUF202 family)
MPRMMSRVKSSDWIALVALVVSVGAFVVGFASWRDNRRAIRREQLDREESVALLR